MRTELYLIEGPWSGRLAIAPRPRGGDWLEDEVHLWQQAGLDIVISLLKLDEVVELGLEKEEEWCGNFRIEFISFPVTDRGVPTSRDAFLTLVRELWQALEAGKRVAVHCRQGVGRSALLAASLLVTSGEETENAFQRISEARGCFVPDTDEQKEWVEALAPELSALPQINDKESEAGVFVHPA